MDAFLKLLGAEDLRILTLLTEGVAFKQHTMWNPILKQHIKCGGYYVVYSHAGDDLSLHETPFAIEGMIHRAKLAGYGYLKMTPNPGSCDAGLTFYNYNELGIGSQGIWVPGMPLTRELLRMLPARKALMDSLARQQ